MVIFKVVFNSKRVPRIRPSNISTENISYYHSDPFKFFKLNLSGGNLPCMISVSPLFFPAKIRNWFDFDGKEIKETNKIHDFFLIWIQRNCELVIFNFKKSFAPFSTCVSSFFPETKKCCSLPVLPYLDAMWPDHSALH